MEEIEMQFVQKTIASLALALLSLTVHAAESFAGYTDEKGNPLQGGETELTCTSDGQGFTLTFTNLALVRINEKLPGGRDLPDHTGGTDSVLTWTDNPKAFTGTVYLVPLGQDWTGKSAAIGSVDTTKALGSGQVGNNTVTIRVVPRRADMKWFPMTAIFTGSIGDAWFSIVTKGGAYQASNKRRDPLLLIGRNCEQPTAVAKDFMAQQE